MTPAQGATSRASACPTRTKDLPELWRWLIHERDAAHNHPPLRLHVGGRDTTPSPGDVQRKRRNVLGSPDFSPEFIAYLDRDTAHGPSVQWRSPNRDGVPSSPLRRAMKQLYSPGARAQSFEYRIVSLLVDGGYDDREEVRKLIGSPRPDFFEAAAVRGIAFVKKRTEEYAAVRPAA